MVRSSLEPNATHVFNSHMPNGQFQYSNRQEDGGVVTVTDNASVDVPCLWLRMSRKGNVITTNVACASDTNNIEDDCNEDPPSCGINESDQISVEISMMSSVFVGLVVTSFDGTRDLNVANFRHVQLSEV
jgi:hypothetical protein